MLHELMQACLTEGRWDETWREEQIGEIVGREVPGLWGMGLEVGLAREEMERRSEGFATFAEVFAGDEPKVFLQSCHPPRALSGPPV